MLWEGARRCPEYGSAALRKQRRHVRRRRDLRRAPERPTSENTSAGGTASRATQLRKDIAREACNERRDFPRRHPCHNQLLATLQPTAAPPSRRGRSRGARRHLQPRSGSTGVTQCGPEHPLPGPMRRHRQPCLPLRRERVGVALACRQENPSPPATSLMRLKNFSGDCALAVSMSAISAATICKHMRNSEPGS